MAPTQLDDKKAILSLEASIPATSMMEVKTLMDKFTEATGIQVEVKNIRLVSTKAKKEAAEAAEPPRPAKPAKAGKPQATPAKAGKHQAPPEPPMNWLEAPGHSAEVK